MAAFSMLQEARRVLDGPTVMAALDYWEGRLEVIALSEQTTLTEWFTMDQALHVWQGTMYAHMLKAVVVNAWLQIEVIRNQGPMVWKLYFEGILATAHRHYNSGLGNLPLWNWVECDVCKNWRLVSGGRGRMHRANQPQLWVMQLCKGLQLCTGTRRG
jgi:hypothetical protein